MSSPTSRTFANNSEVITLAATRENSVQIHDYNSNTVLLVTMKNPSRSSSTSSRRTLALRDSHSTASESAGHESDADESDDDQSQLSDLTPSERSLEGTLHYTTILKRVEANPSRANITMALSEYKQSPLSSREKDAIMDTLHIALQVSDSNADRVLLHPDFRAEVHLALAQHFFTKGQSGHERSQSYCRSALLLLHGRGHALPKLTADLHVLLAKVLLEKRGRRDMQDIFNHIRSARIFLLGCGDMQVANEHVELFSLLGYAHSVCSSAPLCQHLLAGFDAYMSAIELIRHRGHEHEGVSWMQLTCVAAQLGLRFLRHRRLAAKQTNDDCWCGSTVKSGNLSKYDADVSGMFPRPDNRKVEICELIEMMENVCNKLSASFDDVKHDHERVYEMEQRKSVVDECLGRCYVERSIYRIAEEGGKVAMEDLRKGCYCLQNALRSCEWYDEYAGQRYVSICELLEESRRRLGDLESKCKDVSLEDGEYEWDDSLWDGIDSRKKNGHTSGALQDYKK